MNRQPRVSIALALALGPVLALPACALGPADAEGLWQGRMIFARAQQELDVVVELARTPAGEWVGTFDVPTQGIRFHPLRGIRVAEGAAGVEVELQLERGAREGLRADYRLRGTLSDDGTSIEGSATGAGRPAVPFTLERLGPPGTPRLEPAEMPVEDLSPGSPELRDLFERDRGRMRLVLLLSPD